MHDEIYLSYAIIQMLKLDCLGLFVYVNEDRKNNFRVFLSKYIYGPGLQV
jgi:hypothetical protein